MEITFEGLKITGIFKGLKEADWGSDIKNWNHHLVTIQNEATKEEASFDYWCSIAEPRFKEEKDLLRALACWLDDANNGQEDYDGFCINFGYEEDSRKARKIWRTSQRTYKQAQRIIGDEEKQQELLELLEQLGHR